MKTHKLVQGSPEWLAYRSTHFNASDAPAMMGLSKYKSRTQLLKELSTGFTPEVDSATQRRFDDGHRFEALARPIAEGIIGEDLYPAVGSEGELSASFDGLTMMGDVAFEHKTLNEELRACMRQQDGNANDFLPPMYHVQMEQQMMVSGAEKVLFMASQWAGDELVEERHCWYVSNPELRQQIIDGWAQLKDDLATYVAPEVMVAAVAEPQISLPAVMINVNGSIALVDNLDKFGTALTAYIEQLNRKPETDQDFANLEDAVKRLKAAEDMLDAAESGALGQTESIDTMRRTVALHRETARSTRLLIDKLVKAEKENRRATIISSAVTEFNGHIQALNTRLGKAYMPTIPADFQGVVKGLKSIDSMRDKVSTELARAKIEANAAADRIQANLETLKELASDHKFLFADTSTIVMKANDDLVSLIKSRIADHAATEAAKEEATRARIQAEEQAKAEARAKAAQAEERAREAAEKASADAIARAQVEAQKPAPALVATAPAAIKEVAAPVPVCESVQVAPASKPKADAPPTLPLGEISTRLGFNCTSAFLATLGFEATTVRASKLYQEDDFLVICAAVIDHIKSVQAQFETATA